MPAFDARLMFMSSGNLTKTSTLPAAGLKIRGTPVHGIAARVIIPRWTGTKSKMVIALHVSKDDSTYYLASTYPGGSLSNLVATAGSELIIPLACRRVFQYVKIVFTLTGGTTGTSYGAVKAGLVEGVGFDKSRAVQFT